MPLGVDIEPTNRCNAQCYFCPRDATPHQGLMTREVFEQSLERCGDLKSQLRSMGRTDFEAISLCGLGEPLLNRLTPQFVERVRAEGFRCAMSTNAALLDEQRSHELLESGLQAIWINVGDRDADYEEVYKLPFERTHDNILRFRDLAGDDCQVLIVLVNHRDDPEHLKDMRRYWGDHGLNAFVEYEVINRGGALFVEHMQFEAYPQVTEARAMLEQLPFEPACAAPYASLFIGYDGQYYLCCSDWKKEVPLGSVFDTSFVEVMHEKLRHVRTRGRVCETCSMDPLNKVTGVLHARDAGDTDSTKLDAMLQTIRTQSAYAFAEVEQLTGTPAPPLAAYNAPARRPTIPVTAV